MFKKGSSPSGPTFSWCAAILALTLLVLWPLTGWTADMRIGFVNMQKAVADTEEFKKALKRFKDDFEKEKSIIVLKEKKVQQMLADINKQSFVLDPALKKQKEEQFIREKKELERYVQDRNEEFGMKEKEITNRILIKMLDIIKTIGKQRKMSMILEKNAVFYSDSSSDLTSLATQTYNKTNK